MRKLLEHFTKRNIILLCLGLCCLFIADVFHTMDRLSMMLLFIIAGFSCFAIIIHQKQE